MVLCDTNIIIELLKGNPATIKSIEEFEFNNIAVSSITVMELLFGALDKREAAKIKKYIYSLSVIQIDETISQKAVGLIESYAKSHSLSIPDAIIAATSLVKNHDLFTYNTKDFRFIKGLVLA